eukprot:14198597-Alexandrium_andersonii.AAC.1
MPTPSCASIGVLALALGGTPPRWRCLQDQLGVEQPQALQPLQPLVVALHDGHIELCEQLHREALHRRGHLRRDPPQATHGVQEARLNVEAVHKLE